MSSSNQRPANRGFRSVLRCAISHYRQSPLAVCTRTMKGHVKLTGCRESKPPHLVFRCSFTNDIFGLSQPVMR